MIRVEGKIAEALERIEAKRRRRLRWYVAGWAAVVAALLIAFAAGCEKPVPPPVSPSDAVPSCELACAHVEDAPPAGLGCPTNGACRRICAKVKRASWRACINAQPTCDQVDRCGD